MRGASPTPFCARAIATFEVRAKAFGSMSERFIDELKADRAHPAQPSMMKYYGTELNKSRHELMMAAGGSDLLEWESEASRGGAEARAWLRTKANSIEGGTSEVQLNIIAKRILELPSALIRLCSGAGRSVHNLSVTKPSVLAFAGTRRPPRMPLFLDDDQTALQDTIRDFVAEHAPVKHMRALRDAKDATGFSRDLWKSFAEMGFTGIPDRRG